LKIVWSASDTAAPKGQLNKEEFFGACKLIAVKQSGGALHSFKCIPADWPANAQVGCQSSCS
jgi:hypothetical protein